MNESLLETYWIEIPCKDEEAARRLAETLKAFKPRINVHKLVRRDGDLHIEYQEIFPTD